MRQMGGRRPGGGLDGSRSADQRRQTAKTRDSDMPFLFEPTGMNRVTTTEEGINQGANEHSQPLQPINATVIFYISIDTPFLFTSYPLSTSLSSRPSPSQVAQRWTHTYKTSSLP